MTSDWWPSVLGGKISYALSWGATLLIGLASHHLDLFNLRERWRSKHPEDDVDWERKSEHAEPCTGAIDHAAAFWVGLSFLAMLMPAIACFSKLKKDKRHKYRNSMPGLSSVWVPFWRVLKAADIRKGIRGQLFQPIPRELAPILVVHDLSEHSLLLCDGRTRRVGTHEALHKAHGA